MEKLIGLGMSVVMALFIVLVIAAAVFQTKGMMEWCEVKHPELSMNACLARYSNTQSQRIELENE